MIKELKQIIKALEGEKALNQNLKDEICGLKGVITGLQEQIANHAIKQADTNAELSAAKDSIILEKETLIQEKEKVMLLSSKLSQKEEEVRQEIEKNAKATADIQSFVDVINKLKDHLCNEKENHTKIIKQTRKDDNDALQTMRGQYDQEKSILEDEIIEQKEENEIKINVLNSIHETNVAEMQMENETVNNKLLETLATKTELEEKVIEMSQKSDLLFASCKDLELAIQHLLDEKKRLQDDAKLQEEKYQKERDDEINRYGAIIQSKNNEIQAMQSTLDEEMEQRASEKSSFDGMIMEIEYFMQNMNNRIQIVGNGVATSANQHSAMNQKMIDFHSRFNDNHKGNITSSSVPANDYSSLVVRKSTSSTKSVFNAQTDSLCDDKINIQPIEYLHIPQSTTNCSDETLELYNS